MKAMHMIAFILLVIGGLNWGLIGIGGFAGVNLDVIGRLLGGMPQVEWIVYILVGLSALWIGITHKKDCKMCGVSSSTSPMM